MAERPANGGLSRLMDRSPASQFWDVQGQFAESLRPLPQNIPVLGDIEWRQGSITTAWRTRESDAAFDAYSGPKLNDNPKLEARLFIGPLPRKT